MSIETLMRRV